MAETKEKDDFEFEIETEEKVVAPQQETKEAKGKPEEEEVEVVDDTPEPDRNRKPTPPEVVKELEEDELEEYSEKVKSRLINMKRVWHDERRAKEAALREQQEAVEFARKMLEENKRLKTKLSTGEKTLIDTTKSAAELEFEMAKRAYKEAYDSGDADQITDAQTKLAEATWKVQRVKEYQPTLQEQETEVKIPQTTEDAIVPRLDSKTMAWQERNHWWGKDEEMTALALGYHQKLEKQYGAGYIGTDEYWNRIDETMRKRFPDYDWGDEPKTTNGGGKPVARAEKPATVVAPASRSTNSKKIVLKQSEVALAKKFGLTAEQYAREKMRLENQNG